MVTPVASTLTARWAAAGPRLAPVNVAVTAHTARTFVAVTAASPLVVVAPASYQASP